MHMYSICASWGCNCHAAC